jgi:hypothetical protein
LFFLLFKSNLSPLPWFKWSGYIKKKEKCSYTQLLLLLYSKSLSFINHLPRQPTNLNPFRDSRRIYHTSLSLHFHDLTGDYFHNRRSQLSSSISTSRVALLLHWSSLSNRSYSLPIYVFIFHHSLFISSCNQIFFLWRAILPLLLKSIAHYSVNCSGNLLPLVHEFQVSSLAFKKYVIDF